MLSDFLFSLKEGSIKILLENFDSSKTHQPPLKLTSFQTYEMLVLGSSENSNLKILKNGNVAQNPQKEDLEHAMCK